MKMLRALIVTTAVSLALPLTSASALVIPPYGPGATAIVGVLANPNGTATITAGGFCPGTTVVVTIGGVTVDSGAAGADGTVTFIIPSSELPSSPGVYPVVAASSGNSNGDCDRQDQASFSIDAAALPSPGVSVTGGTSGSVGVGSQVASSASAPSLPVTGASNSVSIARFAVISIVGGLGLLVVAAMRRRSSRVRLG